MPRNLEFEIEGLGVDVRLFEDLEGVVLGTVSEVVHGAQDLLVIARTGGGQVMVPFVGVLVPEVDVAAGRLVVDLPNGLLDLTVD